MSDNLQKFSAALPEEVTFTWNNPGTGFGDPSYLNLNINSGSTLDGLYDAWCVDTDRLLFGASKGKVFSSYEELPPELLGPGNIEKPENLDSVNWIINQGLVGTELFDETGNSLGIVTYGDVQRAIWEIIDDENTTGGLGPFSEERAQRIAELALTQGDGFVPEFGDKLAVIITPDTTDDGVFNPDRQFVIVEVELSKLGDFVFEDSNANGIQDGGENGIEGVTVNLLADIDGDGEIEAGEIVDSTTTDADGMYMFTVVAGDYKVEFEQPDGFDGVSPANQGGDDTVDSDGLISDVINLDPGENDPTIDQGFYQTASLGDFVFLDEDGDGIQDPGEAGVAGVEVKLQNPDGSAVLDDAGNPITTMTDANGAYSFTGLTPGEYKVMFVAPDGFEFTTANAGGDDTVDSDADPTNGMTQTVVLESGDFNDTLDAGLLVQTASLGDFVFEDDNANGIQDDGEAGIAGVEVKLLADSDGDGQIDDVVATTDTAGDGSYAFTGLTPGVEYKVMFTQPDGFDGVSPFQAGNNTAVDSDADPNNGLMSDVVVLDPGENNPTIDAGFFKTAGLGDFVFLDEDGDGLQDPEEEGVAGVEVKLQNPDGSAVLDDAGNPITTMTDANGEYAFTGLVPGEYKVMFVAPDGFEFTIPNANSNISPTFDEFDSDADPTNGMTQTVVLESGDFNDTLDAGLILVPTASLGDTVFEDLDADGIQDLGEPGIAGATVKLLDGNGNPVLDENGNPITTTTDENGKYEFTGLTPGVEYKVMFTQPDGFDGVSPFQAGGDDTVDSDADPNNGLMSDVVVLDPGENNPTIDAGFFKTAGLGDFVFLDEDGDGIQDPGEDGIAEVEVKLQNPDGSAVLDDAGNPITTMTDANGEYAFTGLIPGEYKVMFVAPDGFEFTTANAGGDDTVDSDADPTNGMTQTVVLESGDFNDTLDAGLLVQTASLGDFVFEDDNANGIQDDGEAGIAGVEVKLLADSDGDGQIDDVVATTDTAADGSYAFTGLTPGVEYKVMFTQPDGFDGVSPFQAGGDDTVDSDADPNNGLMSDVVVLDPGENNPTIDAGFFKLIPSIDLEKFTRVDANPLQLTKLVAVEPMSGDFMGQDLCETGLGKPEALVFQYNPGSTVDTNQDSDKARINFNGMMDDDGTSFIVVSEEDEASKALNGEGKQFFRGNVDFGDLFEANEATDSFGSKTFIHFFDNANGGLLQTIEYHTSCSQPIQLGDVIGNATLFGYDGEDAPLVTIPEPEFVDANEAPGPETRVGSQVEFQYVVTNTGDTALSNVVVTDDRLDNVTFVEGDTNNNGLLESSETWIYTASETAGSGLITNKGTVTAQSNGQSLMAMDIANYTGLETSPILGDVCDVLSKPEALVFQYNPGNTVDTNQDSDKARINFNGGIDDDGTSFVVVTDEDEANKALSGDGKQFFRGNVDFGDLFEANDNSDSFGSKTFIHFFDDANGGLLQTVEYHTSCSQPIQLGDVVGNATLFGYDGEDSNLVTLPQDTSDGSNNSGDTDSNTILLEVDNPFDPNNIGEDADNPTGPLAQKGDIVTWTYQATNTGNVDLTILDLVDDNDTPNDPSDDFTPEEVLVNGFNFGDSNQDGIFNPEETWYFQAKEVAQETGQFKNTAVITAEGIGQTVTDMDMSHRVVNPLDIEKLVAVEPINGGQLGQDVCETEGKADAILFEYNPGNLVNTAQDSDKAGIVGGSGAVDNDGVSFIIVSDENDATKALSGDGKQFFRGTVAFGETFLADESTDSFGSNTFIHFFDSNAGGLLQSINYHTSCSQPIRLGDVVGNATLVGYDGENGGLVTLPEPEFVDADNPSGPQTIVGTEVQFKYVVTNTGNQSLTNVQVTDDKIADLELVDNGNGDNILDAGEQWIYAASEDAVLGQRTNKATVTANIGNLELMDMDTANYEGIITPPPQGDVCDTLGKPEAMTFTYDPGTDVLTGQDSSKAGVLTQNGVDDDGTSFVVVTDEDDITKVLNGEGKQFFRGDVAFGESFQATNTSDDFGSNTYIHFFDDQTGGLLQSINYHTSCSQPIAIGDVVGNATLAEYFGDKGGYDNPMIEPVNTGV